MKTMIGQSKLWVVAAVSGILLTASSRADEFGSKGAGWYVRPPVANAAPVGPFTSQLECIVVAKATTNANGIHDGTPYSCSYLTAQVVADLTGKTK
jgi:hypothetical protein